MFGPVRNKGSIPLEPEGHALAAGTPFGNHRTNLYRIAQEGHNNLMKHANARNVSVLLLYHKERLELVIEDDGSGPPAGNNVNEG